MGGSRSPLLYNARTFANLHNLIDRHTPDDFRLPVGPSNFYLIRFSAGTHAEVQSPVVV